MCNTGCRLPGAATSPTKLWDLLINGKSGHGEMPKSRFNAEGFYHPDASHPVSINSTGGYFLEDDIRSFDNAFFGINNLEATYMDPQQRQLLEVCFECFESAGVTLEQLSGADVGCYVANFLADFVVLQSKDPELFHRYSATGMGLTILANRISNAFNLKGPSFVLDTACSSSLYALHTACSALRMGDCSAAVVAGANLVQTPELHLTMVKAGFLSPTSQCHTFDSSADGYGRGEGVGALYLKRLSDAIRDGDPIRSVIRGTSVNSNGHTNGLTLPSVSGQEAVIRKAYAMAGLPTDETDYIEAHGTGTAVGDPIEVEALSRVFKHKSGRPTLIGSVKTNLGHSEAVSGITSIIKVTLALENGIIPPTIGIKQLNPKLQLSERNVEVVTKNTKWPVGNVARASVNSFGYGGANAHAILEAAVNHVPQGYAKSRLNMIQHGHLKLLPFSAHDERALFQRVGATKPFLKVGLLDDLAFTLGSRRSRLTSCGYLLLDENKSAYVKGSEGVKTLKTEAQKLSIAFVFTGQGAQWPQMGLELFSAFPVYRQTIQQLDDHLAGLPQRPSWTISGSLSESSTTSAVSKASHSQTVCTAIQIALVTLLRDWNVTPEAVIGHSSGEISAAFAAGYLTATEAITIAYYRGLVVTRLPPTGAMAAIGLGSKESELEILALSLQRYLRVACINSPQSTTVSGDSAAIDQLVHVLDERGIFARRLKTDDKAYHSHHMLSVGQEYEQLVSSIYAKRTTRNSDTTIKMFSSVTGHLGAPKLIDTAAYWRRNLESPVLFSDSMEDLLHETAYHLIELGPHSTLQQPIKQIQESIKVANGVSLYSSTLTRGKDAERTLLEMAGTLFLNHHPIDINSANRLNHREKTSRLRNPSNRVIYDLPAYDWNHQTLLWNESRSSALFREREHARHDLLGSRISDAAPQTMQWRNVLKVDEVPWLEDHRLGSTMVFPGAAYLALPAEALSQVQKSAGSTFSGIKFKDVHIQNVLVLEDDKHGMELFTELRPSQMSIVSTSGAWWQFEITSLAENMTTVHASGLIAVLNEVSALSQRVNFSNEVMEEQATRTWYDKFTREGLRFGPSFRSLTKIFNDRSKKICRTVSETQLLCGGGSGIDGQSMYMIHPVTLDALLQTAIIASASGSVPRLRGKVPVKIGTAEISATAFESAGDICTIYADSESVGFGTININTELRSPTGHVLASMGDVRAVAYNEGGLQLDGVEERNPILRTLWKPDVAILDLDHAPQFTEYTNRFASQLCGELCDSDFGRFAGAVDLLTHSNPRLRILELGNTDAQHTATLLDFLHAGTSLKRFNSYKTSTGIKNDKGKLIGRELPQTKTEDDYFELKSDALFDLVLLPPTSSIELITPDILKLLSPHANILLTHEADEDGSRDGSLLSVIATTPSKHQRTIAITHSKNRPDESLSHSSQPVLLVERNTSHPLASFLHRALTHAFGRDVERLCMQDITQEKIPYGAIVVSTLELDESLLESAQPDDIECIKALTDNSSTLVWITGGAHFKAKRPSFSLISGLARSLMLEQPSLKMYTVDLDNLMSDFSSSSANIIRVLQQALFSPKPEFEYSQYSGVMYSSRFVPEDSMNKRFRNAQNAETRSTKLLDVGHCQLSIKSAGQLDSIHFEQQILEDPTVAPGFVEVQVKAVGLNAKDFYALHGRVDTKLSTCSCEFSGVITQLGSSKSRFNLGDRVVVMAPTHFGTFETVPEWACCLLKDDEDFTVCSTIPLVFSTALYALEQRAQLQAGETILIHSAAGGLGLAAIQIAKARGAKIFATVGTEEKKNFLINTFGLPEDHIFSSRDSSFLSGILVATSGRGVDVVLNSLTGDLLHDSWSACAEFGRFVEVGKKDIIDGGKLDMSVFERGVTFTAFDLSSLFWSKNERQHTQWST
jgi:acyl transferase domain-containing protein/NADPH:quinone reductase-like Zn-dependent oxidoreductase